MGIYIEQRISRTYMALVETLIETLVETLMETLI